MKQSTLKVLALVMGATSLCTAGETTPAVEATPAVEQFSFCEWLPSKFQWFDAQKDNAVNPYIQSFAMTFRAQYQWAVVDPNGDHQDGRSSNNEFRRLRLGAKATVFEDYKVEIVWNIGGVNKAYKYNNSAEQHTSTSLESFSVARTINDVKLHLGKMKPDYIGEKRTSSSKIKTIERSAIVNQLAAGANLWGLSVADANKKSTISWKSGVYLNGVHDDTIWTEPALNEDTSAMLAAAIIFKTGDNSKLYVDYMHSFATTENSAVVEPYSVGYESIGAKDVLAFSYEYKKDEWYFMGELVGGFNVNMSNEGAENVFGLVLMPTYKFNDHVEGVFRYALSAGSNAAKCYSRYYTMNSDYSSTSDLLNSLYFGVNYYICPSSPDMMKIMAGIEYLNSEGTSAAGDKGFTGWQFATALRVNF